MCFLCIWDSQTPTSNSLCLSHPDTAEECFYWWTRSLWFNAFRQPFISEKYPRLLHELFKRLVVTFLTRLFDFISVIRINWNKYRCLGMSILFCSQMLFFCEDIYETCMREAWEMWSLRNGCEAKSWLEECATIVIYENIYIW